MKEKKGTVLRNTKGTSSEWELVASWTSSLIRSVENL
jgi:hypothetical protein